MNKNKLPVKCVSCETFFLKTFLEIKRTKIDYCSRSCYLTSTNQEIKISCKNCGKVCNKKRKEIKRYKNNFCSHSCRATYNNTHRTKGTRISKLEVFIQEKLKEQYDFNFHFNRKDTINSELDIYIPELKLAFELNGVFHYEPIFGEEKLNQIQNNDDRKFQACLEQQIELCIIDTSWIKYNKVSNFEKILNIIVEVISTNENAGS